MAKFFFHRNVNWFLDKAKSKRVCGEKNSLWKWSQVITGLITRTTFHSSLTTRSLSKKSGIISGISTVILKFVGKPCVNTMKILNSTLLSFYPGVFVFLMFWTKTKSQILVHFELRLSWKEAFKNHDISSALRWRYLEGNKSASLCTWYPYHIVYRVCWSWSLYSRPTVESKA